MSQGSGVPYIGSRISLISKSEIRYEGYLYTIDTQNSTVALQNVRSFGTEGRRQTGPQIPASAEIYDYIIFRGADIKDLHVNETPKAAVPDDPAIVSSQAPPQPKQQQQPPRPQQQQQQYQQPPQPPQQQQQSRSRANNSKSYQQFGKAPANNPWGGAAREPSSPVRRQQQQMEQERQQFAAQRRRQQQQKQQQKQPPQQQRQDPPKRTGPPKNAWSQGNRPNLTQYRGGNRQQQNNHRNNSGRNNNNNNNNGMRSNRNSMPGMGGHLMGMRARGAGGRGSSKMTLPDNQFDFNAGLAEFAEFDPKASASALEGADAIVPAQKYNKATSFFDSISCDALDKLKKLEGGGDRRPNYRTRVREENETNMATFGATSLNQANGHGRQNNNRRNNNGRNNNGRNNKGNRSNGQRERSNRAQNSTNWRSRNGQGKPVASGSR